jgi:Asp-tRNA(Asn)/Glu-tRNA(Gln) amidotransferase C subunit
MSNSTMRVVARSCAFRTPSLALQLHSNSITPSRKAHSKAQKKLAQQINIEELLSTPTWSVASLLPDTSSMTTSPITPEKLRHLLRLSALPEPKTPEEESKLLSDLSSQLHFVRQVQEVDVSGIEPLQAIRDESEAGERAAEITIEKLKDVFANEEIIGKHYKRLRRKKNDDSVEDKVTPAHWKPLEHAGKTAGKYFIVDRSEEKKG